MQRDRRLKRVSKLAIYNSEHNGKIMRLKEIQWPLLTKNIAYNGQIWRFNVIISQIRLGMECFKARQSKFHLLK